MTLNEQIKEIENDFDRFSEEELKIVEKFNPHGVKMYRVIKKLQSRTEFSRVMLEKIYNELSPKIDRIVNQEDMDQARFIAKNALEILDKLMEE